MGQLKNDLKIIKDIAWGLEANPDYPDHILFSVSREGRAYVLTPDKPSDVRTIATEFKGAGFVVDSQIRDDGNSMIVSEVLVPALGKVFDRMIETQESFLTAAKGVQKGGKQ